MRNPQFANDQSVFERHYCFVVAEDVCVRDSHVYI